MLDIAKVNHERFTTESETYMDEWVAQLDLKKMLFTEFVVIGGDGMLFQLVNAFKKHPDSKLLLKFPIGIVPGGSANAT